MNKNDFDRFWTSCVPREARASNENIFEDVIKAIEDSEKLRKAPSYRQFWIDYPKYAKIVEQIEKRIIEIRYQLDHTNPDMNRSIALQEALQEMVNLIGFEKYEEIMVGKK